MKQQKTLSEKTVQSRLEKLSRLEQQKKDIQLQIDLIKDGLKNNMDSMGLSSLKGTTLYCYYKEVTKNIVDNDKLKTDGIYNQYLKTIGYKYFDYQPIK